MGSARQFVGQREAAGAKVHHSSTRSRKVPPTHTSLQAVEKLVGVLRGARDTWLGIEH